MASIVRHTLEWIFLIPTIGGSVYAVLCVLAVIRFRRRPASLPQRVREQWPPVTVLKPVHGLEKNQRENLRSCCLQDYPEFQVVFSVQDKEDAAIPLLKELQREFGADRVTVAIENCRAGTNGKINNMIGGLRHARHDVLVISDSDVLLKPDYLKTIVAPLSDPERGLPCTLYKAAGAETWFEKMELLTLNADFMANVLFAHISGASKFCLGASAALHRSTLEQIGGLEALSDYLVEDYEMGRRIWMLGKKIAVVPYFVDTIVDLKSPSQWWDHQVYWDQNTRAARPMAFFATALVRSVPFAILYAIARMGDAIGLYGRWRSVRASNDIRRHYFALGASRPRRLAQSRVAHFSRHLLPGYLAARFYKTDDNLARNEFRPHQGRTPGSPRTQLRMTNYE